MRGSLDPACGWRETQPISILSLLDPRAFDLQNFPFSQANRDGHLNNAPELLPAFELGGIVLSHLADERQFLWFCDSGSFFCVRQFDMLQRVSVQCLVTHGDIENPVKDLPFTTDGAGRRSFVQPSLHKPEPILRFERR